jgi:flagellar hook-associated protein 2
MDDILSTLNRNGTGLDLRALATSLVTAEIRPQQQALQRRVEADALRLTALSEVRAQLNALGDALAEVAGNPIRAVTTSTSSILPNVTDRSLLVDGTTEIEVTALAARQVLEFKGFSARDAVLQEGSLTIAFGSWTGTSGPQTFTPDAARTAVTLTVAAGTTLEELAEQVSGVTGLKARVLTKGDGTFSLGIVGETGANNAIRLTAAGTGPTTGGEVALSGFDTTATNATAQVQAAANAQVIVDGILISRTTNTLTDIVPGLSVTLSAVVTGTITIDRDLSIAQSNMEKLVEALNETLSLLRRVTARGVGGAAAGDLSGDSNVQGIALGLRALLARPLKGHGDRDVNLADLGIATQRDGSLWLDQTVFDRAFATSVEAFDAVLGDSLNALTEGLTAGGFPGPDLASGEYEFNVALDGSATLGGARMTSVELQAGVKLYTAAEGTVAGISIRAEVGITTGKVRFGRSFVGAVASFLQQTMSSTGAIGQRETELNRATTLSSERLTQIEAKAAVLERRYISRFAAMERSVTQFNSAGTYLTNLVRLWSKSDN